MLRQLIIIRRIIRRAVPIASEYTLKILILKLEDLYGHSTVILGTDRPIPINSPADSPTIFDVVVPSGIIPENHDSVIQVSHFGLSGAAEDA